ncbi:hypothetical protein HYFRA_00000630 [Hymenoscyphus fraxineus]|uniref:F-box domain-containing protein n=1 Tax=Hymenoscyphus fraxineus TaxID=746836 RepID=A0A9N9L5T8_9HELO|nr:hypothetical protein HYFRA_00000630 [Hymenoscyphus fraxineus]
MAAYEPSPPDEGYSEDPLTMGATANTPTPLWLSKMTVPERTEYVMGLIDQLPTSALCEIVNRLRPRLYINFFQYLPPEVCLKILGFLDPISLIHTARASREWMRLALDRRLWEALYMMEGFRVIRSEVQKFELAINANDDRSRPTSDSEHDSKRRATPQRIIPTLHTDDDYEMVDADSAPAPVPVSIFGPVLTSEPKQADPAASKSDTDIQMVSPKGYTSSQASKSSEFPSRNTTRFSSGSIQRSSDSIDPTYSRYSGNLSNMSSLVVVDRGDKRKKLNWQYLYSQRRRLEANWEAEKYVNFQLPHPQYPEEAHQECIYTIQHCGKYLVSGSRDQTLRIWNLNTQRLVRSPLRAHSGSVLCLQFDADPEEDLIVSGSSDATVVLWRFSTGQIIQRLRKAHRESVLNVKFDKRVLITCSKDKTIKIFNRRSIHPGDTKFPGSSNAVDPVPTYLNNYGLNPSPTAGLIPAYTLIGCLEGHHAAVNAVQIHGDEIVSASGDRTVKVWNWKDQKLTKTLIGHTKGIACVQYDGRRIVSGSSDNEVKVFDRVSGVEVASLRGHSHLVRTVQAGFGDLPYSTEDDQQSAKNIDGQFFKALESGAITREMYQQRGRPRNAGSRRPEDITAYGASLPPGGGGGKFGRIVSGSYDETIIIWRRDKEGVWRAQHTLRQEEAANNASRESRAMNHTPSANTQAAPTSLPMSMDTVDTTTPTASQNTTAPNSSAQVDDTFYRHLVDLIIPQGPVALRHGLHAHPQMLNHPHLGEAIQALSGPLQQAMSAVVAHAMQSRQQPFGGASSTTSQPANQQEANASQTPPSAPVSASAPAPMQPPAAPQNADSIPGTLPDANPVPVLATVQAAPANPPTHHHHHHHLPANMARVFKLQFDARRIICCSQTSVIVGWDFANGDEQIIEASRFFAPVE